jgi:hypothetical protein
MPRRTFRTLRRSLALLLALPAALAACAAPGERADTGECPAGEVCSPLTPNGLTFQGLRFSDVLFDSGLHPTAAGGSQPIDVRYGTSTGGDGTLLFHPFTPLTSDDAFTATANGAVVTLAAAAPASGRLRIVDNDGLLMDRIEITSAAPTQIHLRAQTNASLSGRPLALVPGRPINLVAMVLASDGTRLVDQGLTIASDGPTATPRSWDSVGLTAGSAGFTITTIAGGLTVEHAVAVASAAERLEVQPHDPLTRGSSTMVCVSALAGANEVVGLAWTWSAPTGGRITPMTGLLDNCAVVEPTTGEPVGVTVAVAGVTTRLTLPLGGAARSAPAAWPSDLGDRARLIAR